MKKLFILILLCPYMISYGQQTEKQVRQKWRFSLSGGTGYIVAGADAAVDQMTQYGVGKKEAENYYKSLKLGLLGNAEIHYLLNRHFGVGAKYMLFSSAGNSIHGMNMRMQIPGGFFSVDNAAFAEQMYINYAGPSFLFRHRLGAENKWMFTAGVSAGYSHYRNEVTVESDKRYIPCLLTGSSIGYAEQIGLEYFLTKNCAIGVNAGWFYSAFNKLRLKNELISNDITNEKPENVSRVELSLGLRFYR